jgi:hypothetical protein
MPSEKPRISTYVSPEVKAAAEQQAARRGMSLSEYLVTLIEADVVEQQQVDVREIVREELADFQAKLDATLQQLAPSAPKQLEPGVETQSEHESQPSRRRHRTGPQGNLFNGSIK